ncbi:MAG TPA: plastocyanin/azurin family copper-binding protein [Blastococcus sp.]
MSQRTSTPPALRRPARGAAALVLAAAAVVLTACGGGSSSSGTSSSGGGGSSTSAGAATSTAAEASGSAAGGSSAGGSAAPAAQTLAATEADFSITLDKDTLPAGAYSILVTNNGRATHDLVVEQNGKKVAGSDKIQAGQSTTLDVTLDPGKYVFYCSVGNHRAMGMEINVTVQ